MGPVFKPDISKFVDNGSFGMKFYPMSSDDKGMQIGLWGNKKLGKDCYLEGFVDYNFDPKKFVGELQFGKALTDSINLVIEGRYNGFQESEFGIGTGIEIEF